MLYLEPTQYLVSSMEVVSLTREDSSDPSLLKERRVFIGHFNPKITPGEIEAALDSSNLWPTLIGSASVAFFEDNKRSVSQVPRVIDRGVIFESVDEFIILLGKGLRHSDLLEGQSMARNFSRSKAHG